MYIVFVGQKTGRIYLLMGVPGDDWWYCFKKPHPKLTVSVSHKLFKYIGVKRQHHIQWISGLTTLLKPVLDKLDLHHSPDQIFNVDESGFH